MNMSKNLLKGFAAVAMLCMVGSIYASSVDISYLNGTQIQLEPRCYINPTINESTKNSKVVSSIAWATRIIPVLATVARLSYNYAKKLAFKFKYKVRYTPNSHTKISIVIWDKKYSEDLAKRMGKAYMIGIDEPGYGKNSWHVKYGHFNRGKFKEDGSIDIPDVGRYLETLYSLILKYLHDLYNIFN